MFVDTRSMPPKALIVTERLKSVSTIPGLPYYSTINAASVITAVAVSTQQSALTVSVS